MFVWSAGKVKKEIKYCFLSLLFKKKKKKKKKKNVDNDLILIGPFTCRAG
jgi:hypothetical protein